YLDFVSCGNGGADLLREGAGCQHQINHQKGRNNFLESHIPSPKKDSTSNQRVFWQAAQAANLPRAIEFPGAVVAQAWEALSPLKPGGPPELRRGRGGFRPPHSCGAQPGPNAAGTISPPSLYPCPR